MSPDIVYIAGYGRSGSTVLDSSLSSIDGWLGTGELHFLPQYWLDGRDCSCGVEFQACGAWPERPDGFELAAGVTRRVESAAVLGGRAFRVSSSDKAAYRQYWRAVIDGLRERHGAETIVDSSKTMAAARYRIRALRDLAGYDVAVVHLVRDPQAVMASALRTVGSQYSRKLSRVERLARVSLGWRAANYSAMTEAAQRRYHRTDFEDFVADPRREVEAILDSFGVDIPAGVRDFDSLSAGHAVGGNRIRFKGAEIQLRQKVDGTDGAPALALSFADWTTKRCQRKLSRLSVES